MSAARHPPVTRISFVPSPYEMVAVFFVVGILQMMLIPSFIMTILRENELSWFLVALPIALMVVRRPWVELGGGELRARVNLFGPEQRWAIADIEEVFGDRSMVKIRTRAGDYAISPPMKSLSLDSSICRVQRAWRAARELASPDELKALDALIAESDPTGGSRDPR